MHAIGIARGKGIEWIFYGNKLALLGQPALFSKVTLFSLSEVRSVVFCGSQISQIYGPLCLGELKF